MASTEFSFQSFCGEEDRKAAEGVGDMQSATRSRGSHLLYSKPCVLTHAESKPSGCGSSAGVTKAGVTKHQREKSLKGGWDTMHRKQRCLGTTGALGNNMGGLLHFSDLCTVCLIGSDHWSTETSLLHRWWLQSWAMAKLSPVGLVGDRFVPPGFCAALGTS